MLSKDAWRQTLVTVMATVIISGFGSYFGLYGKIVEIGLLSKNTNTTVSALVKSHNTLNDVVMKHVGLKEFWESQKQSVLRREAAVAKGEEQLQRSIHEIEREKMLLKRQKKIYETDILSKQERAPQADQVIGRVEDDQVLVDVVIKLYNNKPERPEWMDVVRNPTGRGAPR